MRKCEDFEALISALLDEEITETERGELMDHLEQCEACKAYLSDQHAMRDALRGLSAAAPAGFADGVMAKVHETAQEGAKKSDAKVISFPRIRRWAGLAACCAVVALGVFALGGLPHTMNQTADCAAAPEMRDNGAPQTFSGGSAASADTAAPDYGVADAARSEMPESQAEDNAAPEEALDQTAVSADEYTALMVCAGDAAQQWVQETLGSDWVVGTYYSLTQEQFGQLQELLQEENEPFTVLTGTSGSDIYLLLAE